VGDLAFVFATTVASSTPAHYERALLGAMIVVHMANFYFGRRQAWRTIGIGMGGYLVLVLLTTFHGLPIDLPDELWSLAIGAGGTALVVLQASDVRRRLGTIVSLFERAEEGDFSQAYDAAADARPDAITRVGRAYNRFRSQLASMVLTDPLTGCLNRRGFDQALAREVARATRAGSELALLAIDLDHFKMVNDTYGHLVGDAALRATGSLLIQAGRAGDLVGRIGGEEFGVLLADTGASGAFQFASRLCDRMRSHPFPGGADGVPLTLTASIGVVAGAPDGDLDFAQYLSARADAALYAAKRSGRDRVRVWTQSEGREADALGDEAFRHHSVL
jgi:diguanylate cyclase (GGDEF)-like protein